MGAVRVLRVAFPLVLGPAPAPGRARRGGLPITFALTGAKADERQVLLGIFEADPHLTATRPGQILIAEKNYYGAKL